MKITMIAEVVGRAGRTLALLRSRCRGGRVVVAALLCNGCERWVKAADWDPETAVCDACTAATTARPYRTITTQIGGTR